VDAGEVSLIIEQMVALQRCVVQRDWLYIGGDGDLDFDLRFDGIKHLVWMNIVRYTSRNAGKFSINQKLEVLNHFILAG
jgi:hypothetical protein